MQTLTPFISISNLNKLQLKVIIICTFLSKIEKFHLLIDVIEKTTKTMGKLKNGQMVKSKDWTDFEAYVKANGIIVNAVENNEKALTKSLRFDKGTGCDNIARGFSNGEIGKIKSQDSQEPQNQMFLTFLKLKTAAEYLDIALGLKMGRDENGCNWLFSCLTKELEKEHINLPNSNIVKFISKLWSIKCAKFCHEEEKMYAEIESLYASTI